MSPAQDNATMELENYRFNVAGTFFLLVQLVILSALIFDPETRLFLVWSCNNFCLFLAIACYLKDMQLVKGISYVGLLTQLLWGADFISPYFGFNVSSITDYITIGGFTYINDVSIVLHTFIPMIVLAFSLRIRPELRSLLYAVPYILFLFAVTLAFTPAAEDINCVFSGCDLNKYSPFDTAYYIWMWPAYAFVSAFGAYVIHHILYFGWHTVVKGRAHIRI